MNAAVPLICGPSSEKTQNRSPIPLFLAAVFKQSALNTHFFSAECGLGVSYMSREN